MVRKVGGRGNKAPYETITIRVPKNLYPLVYQLSHEVKESFRDESTDTVSLIYTKKTLYPAIEEARKILKQRKSAKVSLEKLLQVLYDTEIKLD